jgi:hypothetical protein
MFYGICQHLYKTPPRGLLPLTCLEKCLQAGEPVPLPNLEYPEDHSGHRDLNLMYRPFCPGLMLTVVATGEIKHMIISQPAAYPGEISSLEIHSKNNICSNNQKRQVKSRAKCVEATAVSFR